MPIDNMWLRIITCRKTMLKDNIVSILRVIGRSCDWRLYVRTTCDRSRYKRSWSAISCDYRRSHEKPSWRTECDQWSIYHVGRTATAWKSEALIWRHHVIVIIWGSEACECEYRKVDQWLAKRVDITIDHWLLTTNC